MTSTFDLRGGQLQPIVFDPVTHGLSMAVLVDDTGGTQRYRIACREVTGMRFHNAIPLPWTYADLTETILEPLPDGRGFKLTLVLWDEDCELEISCAEVSIVEGT